MTAETIKAKLTELEASLTQQEAIRSNATQAAQQATMAVQQLQGACAVLRQLLEGEAATPEEPRRLKGAG